MDLAQAVLLGILQGITEWLPISSSAQGMLAMVNLLGIAPEAALSIIFYLHAGSLLAVLVYFHRDIKRMVLSAASGSYSADRKTLSFLLHSTLATAAVGVPLYFATEEGLARTEHINLIIGLALIFTALVLRLSPDPGTRVVESATLRDMLIAGIAQGIAVVPGISRSGITVAALLMLRFRSDEALRLSFLMAVPAIAGANVLSLTTGAGAADAEVVLTGVAAAFLASLVGIKSLLGIARKLRFEYFCAFFGGVALLAWAGQL